MTIETWIHLGTNQLMSTTYVVRVYSHEERWVELGEFKDFSDASTFYDECLELERMKPYEIGEIIRRDIDVNDSDYVVDHVLYRMSV